MDIFLSAEIEGPASSMWFKLQKEFSVLLIQLRNNNYGDVLTSIGIISIIMRPSFFEDGGYKERKFYSKKRKEADIRLRINYQDFVKASDMKRRELYIQHILTAIKIAGNKAGDEFELSRLLYDVEYLLSSSCL